MNIGFEQAESQPLAFIIAALVAYTITPLVTERALKLKLPERSEASRARSGIPRLGGIAILISIIVTIVFYLAVFGRYTPHGVKHFELEAMSIGALIIFFTGLLDDIKPLNPWVKLSAQIFAASTTWLMGLRVEFLANPVHYLDHARSAAISLDDLFSFIITVIFLIAITNAINLIDGVDGLAVGVCMISAIASWAINLSPLLNQPAASILAATMAGACLGFLRYNFNPARIFLGDNGSYLLGFILACISTLGLTKKLTVVVISPIIFLIFALPLIDVIYAIYRRASSHKPIMKPDLGHIHHKLLERGCSHKQINYLFYSLTFLAGLIGTFMLGIDIGMEYLIISASVLSTWLFFSLVINAKKQKQN